MLEGLKRLLVRAPVYLALQRGLGADRLRYRCIDELALRPGEAVLDVGCGPAYYFERLPAVRYFGFDTEPRYIEYARRRWGDRADFRCAVFTGAQLAELPPVDAVLLLGLLHHLSDADSRQLLDLVARALAPGGRVITVDTCFEPRQSRISRWMSENDRGEHVRWPAEFEALARRSFAEVEGEVVSGITRLPSSFWLMRMSRPTVGVQPAESRYTVTGPST
jgi:SAM-dependent methyltransferase